MMVERSLKYVDERLGTASLARKTLRKVFPDHWSFLLGEIALFALVVLVFTGTFLTFFYTPSVKEVVYQGPYTPLQGTEVSAAFNSVLRLSFEVRAGLLMRQTHTGPPWCSWPPSSSTCAGCSSPAPSAGPARSTG